MNPDIRTARQILDQVSPAQCRACGAYNAKQKYPGLSVTLCPPYCPTCQEYTDIVSTCVEEAVRYDIPRASEEALIRVLKWSNKITLRKAAARQLNKLNQQKGAQTLNSPSSRT